MWLSSYAVGIMFRLINFVCLIAFFVFIYRRNKVGQDIAKGIADQEAAVQALYDKKAALETERQNIAAATERQDILGKKLEQQIARWRVDVDRSYVREREAWQTRQEEIKKVMQQKARFLRVQHAQHDAYPQIMGDISAELAHRFQRSQAGKDYIADIIDVISKDAA